MKLYHMPPEKETVNLPKNLITTGVPGPVWIMWKMWKHAGKRGKRGLSERKLSTAPKAFGTVDSVDNLFPEQGISDIYHVSCAHSYQQVAGDAIFRNECFNFFKRRKIFAGDAKRPDFPLQVG